MKSNESLKIDIEKMFSEWCSDDDRLKDYWNDSDKTIKELLRDLFCEQSTTKRRIVTLCGSTRFKEEYLTIQKDLTLNNEIVISVGVFGHSGDTITDEQKELLDGMHLEKIDLADYIYVINVGGYIGDSTKKEIAYAQSLGKLVIYHEQTSTFPESETSIGSYNDLPPKPLRLPNDSFKHPIINPFDPFESFQSSDGITVGIDDELDSDDPYLDEDYDDEEMCDFGYEWCPIPHARKQIRKMTSNPLKRFLNKIVPKRKESLDEYYTISALSALEHCSFTCEIREIKGADD